MKWPVHFRRGIKIYLKIFSALVFFLQTFSLAAHVFTLTDDNSSVTISDPTDEGMKQWLVDGQSQLYQQWFWLRVGNSGSEQPLNTIPILSEIHANPNTLVST